MGGNPMKEKQILEQELLQKLTKKSGLEKSLAAGIQGGFELKKEERNFYLGQFRERILKVLTMEQVEEKVIYPEIRHALTDQKAAKLIVNGKVSREAQERYREEAKKYNIFFTSLSSPQLKDVIGLVIASNEAVDRDDIEVMNREDRLLQKGIPLDIIRGVGKKICSKCYQKLIAQAPEEKDNYQVINWLEKFLGEKCLFCSIES